MKENTFRTIGNKSSQLKLLLLSGFLFFIFLFFLFFEYSTTILFLLFIELAVSIFVNRFFSKFYDLKIENEVLIVENIWEKNQYNLRDLIDIRRFDFVFPYPYNPFLRFVFKDKKEIITKLQNAPKIYLSKGGIAFYISNLKNELIISSYSASI